jgi:hypothetical protein
MAINLREQVENDLSVTVEGTDWGLPVTLISPDGITQTLKKDSTDRLQGQVLFDTRGADPETGMPIVVGEPNVSLRISSLDREPLAGERWAVKIPLSPSITAPLVTLLMSEVRPPERGASIGFVKLFLQNAIQS